ncbi:histidine kinase N-terminal 7TM domain-containing protein [Haloarchaeobius baliensis]|uniref:histidine kinase N-terminal 7TM domain-containing protein n=1 Tax=Haloarchaeobius baliensis TaxID=1670458 RepID=UPI003F883443
MQPLLVAYLASLAFSALLAPTLAVQVWRRHDRPGARWFVFALASVALWSGAQFVSALQPTKAASMPFFKLVYVGAVSLVVAMLLFTLAYTGRDHLITRRLLALLAVEPLVVLALVFTTEQHSYFHRTIALDPATGQLLTVQYAIGFHLHMVYSSVLLAISTALLVQLAMRARDLYRWQAIALVAAVALPWAGSIADVVSTSGLSYTEPSFAFSVIALWVGLFWYDLIDVPPVARATVLETLSDGVLVVDRRGRLVDLNPAAKELLGLDEAAVGDQATSVLASHPDLRDSVDGPGPPSGTVTIETSDGERHLEVTQTPLAARGGNVFVLRDVTGRIERERELERQNERLDQFAGVVSHDLRNPLNVAEGYVDLLEDHVDSQETAGYIAEVQTSHDRMDRIVDDVLALAREGDSVEDPEPVALDGVVADAWAQVDTADAALVCDIDRTVHGDAGQLQRSFENLFRNAVEHGSTSPRSTSSHEDAVEHGSTNHRSNARGERTDHAGRDVTVTVGELEDGEGFFVADDGPGIPPTERDRILDSGYSGSDGGTGLGLAIVDSVVRAHGWTLAVTDAESGGARFEVRDVEFVAAGAETTA